ncbi:DNA helicase, transcript release factor [Choristoneura biennis entomopoxvirus]|uniref:DNA helicase, transcript release factor n=1 Tax=Choristoneura biennis entomopoxvirus TaxID=10288 RepID=A0A916KPM2_CBEPV|nr:DNA helicase, transcript release factor [Choristoneura biennis entomopoxvirus]CCU55672.1 DNA helicase, transcript release factor [Choristoneura biennis entomopoxvirus]
MTKYIKLTKKIFNLFKSKLKSNEILVFDKNFNYIYITDDIIKNNENLDLDIICPIFLYNKDDNSVIKINNFNTNIKCKYILRESQVDVVDKIMDIHTNYSINSPIYISLVCPCGYGKTILGIDIISKVKYKCAIIVPRIFIIKQWVDKIYGGDNKIFASIYGRKKAIEQINNGLDCDIFICPDKHLENDIIRNFIYDTFSMIIIDEAHRYNMNKNITITRFLYNNIFKFCIFLTATPSTNMSTFINEYIEINNDIQHNANVSNNNITKKLIIFELKNNTFGKINDNCKQYVNKIINNNFSNIYIKNYYYKYCISLDENRNKTIIELISKITIKNTKSLILTDYRKHMMDIYNSLKQTNLKNIVYIYDVQDKKCNELFSQFNNTNTDDTYIIISTISACSESLDINNLNTIHIILPITNIKTLKQCVGRIMRNYNENKYVYIYNFSYINKIINMYINDKTDMVKKTLSEWNCVEIKCL